MLFRSSPQPNQGQSTHSNPSSARPSPPSNWVGEPFQNNAPKHSSYQFQKQMEPAARSLARSPQSKPGGNAAPAKRVPSGSAPSAQVPPQSGSAAPALSSSLKRKRPRKADSPEQHESQHGDSESESESEDGGIVVGLGAFMDSKQSKGSNRSRL